MLNFGAVLVLLGALIVLHEQKGVFFLSDSCQQERRVLSRTVLFCFVPQVDNLLTSDVTALADLAVGYGTHSECGDEAVYQRSRISYNEYKYTYIDVPPCYKLAMPLLVLVSDDKSSTYMPVNLASPQGFRPRRR